MEKALNLSISFKNCTYIVEQWKRKIYLMLSTSLLRLPNVRVQVTVLSVRAFEFMG